MSDLIAKNETSTLDSREVAKMVKKNHKELLRDIRTYVDQMNEANVGIQGTSAKLRPSDYFIESTYIGGNGEERPKYDVTKMGCEFIANKLTGVKGTAFTAMYTKRFNQMELTAQKSLLTPKAIKTPEQIQKEIEARYNNSIARKARELRRVIEDPTTPTTYKQVLNSKITEMLTGQQLLPLPAVSEKTYTATEIANEIGTTANMIGRIANKLGLKTPEYGIEVWDKSPHSNKEVPSWRYNEAGRQRIIALANGGIS